MPTHWLRLFIVLLFLSAGSARADTTFIGSPQRVDMVHDAKRGLIYITSGGNVQRYDIHSRAMLSPIRLGGLLGGVDLSPDGDTLVVADRQFTSPEAGIYLVSLNTLSAVRRSVTKASLEGGIFTAVYGSDGNIYTTSDVQGSGWAPFRKFNPSTSTWTTIDSVTAQTMLRAETATP